MEVDLRVLIIEFIIDDYDYYLRLLHKIPDAAYHCTVARGGSEGLHLLDSREFDCVLVDYSLPDMDGLEVLRKIRATWPFLPVILLTGQGNETLAAEAIKGGANDYLTKPVVNADHLHRAIAAVISFSAKRRIGADPECRSLLLVDANQEDREKHIRSLRKASKSAFRIVEATSGLSALKIVENDPPDCMVLDYSLPDMNGLEVLKCVRNRHPFLPVVLLTANGNEAIAVEAIKSGAYDYFTKSSVKGDRLHHAIMAATEQGVLQRNIARKDAQIKEKTEALKASEETFRSAIEDASIGMALVETSGCLLKVNQALCDLLGYNELELLSMDFQSITHPDDLEQDLEYLHMALAGEIKTYQMEKRYLHKNGRIVWGLLSVSLVRHANGEPNYFIGQVQDITERREVERMKSEFISTVSHELRTPLTSISGALSLLAGTLSKDLPENVIRLINIAHQNSGRLLSLINDMLDMDKIASGQMRFDIKEELLQPLIQQAVEANQPYANKHSVSIEALPIAAQLKANVDSERLLQVLANLLSNAAKFSNPGDTVEVAAVHTGKVVRILVKDRGPGISEDFRPRIYTKFSQADSSGTRAKGGTGLGLHISKQMVEHMDGRIGFDTKIGQGTTFWVEFSSSGQSCV